MINNFNKIYFLAWLLLASCGNKIITGTDESSRFRISPLLEGKVDYTLVNNLILTPFCIQCHAWANTEEEVLKRIVPGNPKLSTLFLNVDSGRMPQGLPRISQNLINILQKYIEGLSNFPPLPRLAANFDSIKANIFVPKCLNCHSTGGHASHIPLNTRDDLLNSPRELVLPHNAEESGLVIAVIRTDQRRMPPPESGLPALSENEIFFIKEWINQGASE